MKQVLLVVAMGLALVVTCPVLAQTVDPSAPFERFSYSQDGQDIVITVVLRPPGDSDRNGARFVPDALSIVRDEGPEVHVNQVNGTDLMMLVYRIAVSTATTPPARPFSLTRNWRSFKFHQDYTLAGQAMAESSWHKGPEFTVLRNIVEQPTATVSLTIGDCECYSADRVIVRLSADADVRVRLAMKNNLDAEVASQELPLIGGGAPTPVELKLDPGFTISDGVQYVFEATTQNPNVTLAKAKKDWTATRDDPYTLSADSQAKLQMGVPVRQAKSGSPFELTVQTLTKGDLTLVFAPPYRGTVSETSSSPDYTHTFRVPMQDRPEGDIPFRLEGRAGTKQLCLQESTKTYLLRKDTSTRLAGPMSIKLGNDGFLNIEYSLDREVSNEVAFKDTTVKITATAAPTVPSGGVISYSAKFNPDMVRNLASTIPSDRNRTTVPLTIREVNSEHNPQQDIVSLSVDVAKVDVAAIAAALQQAAGTSDPDTKKTLVGQALGIPPGADLTEDQKRAIQSIVAVLPAPKKSGAISKAISLAIQVASKCYGITLPVAVSSSP